MKIFFISDIHRRKVSEKSYEQIQGKVDIVIIGGDLTERESLERVKDNIIELKKLGPVFFVWGNNDYEVEVPLLDAMILNQGVKGLPIVPYDSSRNPEIKYHRIDDIGTNVILQQKLSETVRRVFEY